MKALFGPPIYSPDSNGAQIVVTCVPHFKHSLYSFEPVEAAIKYNTPEHRIFPTDYLNYKEPPEDTIKRMCKKWDLPCSEIKLFNVYSHQPIDSGWELNIVFLAALLHQPETSSCIRIITQITYDTIPSHIGVFSQSELTAMLDSLHRNKPHLL